MRVADWRGRTLRVMGETLVASRIGDGADVKMTGDVSDKGRPWQIMLPGDKGDVEGIWSFWPIDSNRIIVVGRRGSLYLMEGDVYDGGRINKLSVETAAK